MTNKRGPFKEQALDVLKSRGVPVGAILDVGVLRGTPELMSAFRSLHHVLFEPVEEFYDTIQKHYAKHSHEIVKAAVSDQCGEVSLQTSKKLQGMDISHSSMVGPSTQDRPDVRTVPMITLDSFLAGRELPEPYLLKVDIDGHDMKVLRGATETLRKCSVVIIECVHHNLAERVGFLVGAGFRLFDLVEPCYYDKVFWQCDGIFVRADIFATHFEQLTGAVKPGMYEMFKV